MIAKTTVGQTFNTGENAPVSGVYAFVGHIDGSTCYVSDAQREIPLTKGEKFPPHGGRCNKGVIWRLSRLA